MVVVVVGVMVYGGVFVFFCFLLFCLVVVAILTESRFQDDEKYFVDGLAE